MILRTACATSLLALAAPAGPSVYPYPDDPRIVLVDCDMSKGSAVRVGPRTYLSVNHVTSADNCTVNGKPIKVARVDEDHDFSVFTVNESEAGFVPIDCRGFRAGRDYIAIGHARGLDSLTAVNLVATGQYINGFARLDGLTTVIPGQSGGMMADRITGKLVGMVNVYNMASGLSGSAELKQTEVCRNA